MRLFVAVWPSAPVRVALENAPRSGYRGVLRWVAPEHWHVTLAFLGEVPERAFDDLVAGLRAVAHRAGPLAATLGPSTVRLGRSVLCVPVSGLDPLAEAVRAAVLGRSTDLPFRGHLTLARARAGRSVPAALLSRPLMASWQVRAFSLVSSVTASSGPHYEDLVRFTLAG